METQANKTTLKLSDWIFLILFLAIVISSIIFLFNQNITTAYITILSICLLASDFGMGDVPDTKQQPTNTKQVKKGPQTAGEITLMVISMIVMIATIFGIGWSYKVVAWDRIKFYEYHAEIMAAIFLGTLLIPFYVGRAIKYTWPKFADKVGIDLRNVE